jgi:hypothetical protein
MGWTINLARIPRRLAGVVQHINAELESELVYGGFEAGG